MKILYFLTVALSALFVGCAVNDVSQPQSAPLAESCFFPQTNGIQYTYSRPNLSVIDTSTYQVKVGGSYGDYTQLLKHENGAPGTEVLYFFKTSTDRDGIFQCLLSQTGNPGDVIIALKGRLTIGAVWYADVAEQIQATVVAQYDSYLLPGHEQTYTDVTAVKYVDKNSAEGVFTLRFFARGYGLILERSVVGQASEFTNLQLLSTVKTVGATSGDGEIERVYWHEANHRYMMAPAIEDEEK